MTALDAVSAYPPAVRVPFERLAEPLGSTDIRVRRRHGPGEISLDPERSPAGLPRAAIDDTGGSVVVGEHDREPRHLRLVGIEAR